MLSDVNLNDDDEPWGFALVIAEDHRAVFPLTFDQPIIPQYALSNFNRGVRAFCDNAGIEHTHETAIKCALLMLLHAVLPVAEGTPQETDWRQLTAALMLVSNYTNYRYFTVTSSNADLNVEQLIADSLRGAEAQGKHVLDAFEHRMGRPVAVYYVVNSDEGIDNVGDDL